jgi:hypothetical protein
LRRIAELSQKGESCAFFKMVSVPKSAVGLRVLPPIFLGRSEAEGAALVAPDFSLRSK